MAPGDVARAYGDYLSEFVWAHFATFTTRTPMSADALVAEFLRLVRCAAGRAQDRVSYFYVVERGSSGAGRTRLHALLGGTACLSEAAIRGLWGHGRAEVAAYDPARGAAYYVSKDVRHDWSVYDVSPGPPRAGSPPTRTRSRTHLRPALPATIAAG